MEEPTETLLMKIKTTLSCIVNATTADDLAVQGTSVSTAAVLTSSPRVYQPQHQKS